MRIKMIFIARLVPFFLMCNYMVAGEFKSTPLNEVPFAMRQSYTKLPASNTGAASSSPSTSSGQKELSSAASGAEAFRYVSLLKMSYK